MTYRVTILTPTLVGDGQRLSPIDYMVWKDHVNVLDQKRIFRLLSKGPRLESYLTQLKKSEKLDFASWGGFAQNFAGRRIPFEHPSSTAYWERALAQNLFIPTFAAGLNGPYLPASALKGALRTAVLCGLTTDAQLKTAVDRAGPEGRESKPVTQSLEDAVLGGGAANIMRRIAASDSGPVPDTAFKVYLLRVSSLESRAGKYELQWRQSPRGIARRLEESTALFSEMAVPGTVFEGVWKARQQPEVWRAANAYAEQVLEIQAQYSQWAGLPELNATVEQLRQRLGEIRESGRGCMLVLGWGGGFLSKAAYADTGNENFRQLLRQVPFYSRAVQSGLPFPKTRKVIFLNNQPAALPGFVHLEASGNSN
ncbi:MAG: type III-A CRISPR-associated RAMP protein Csm5 [Bryobacteraceae bacterium]